MRKKQLLFIENLLSLINYRFINNKTPHPLQELRGLFLPHTKTIVYIFLVFL
jgi:hypothetical protein